jgi:hypothetical protein
LREALAKEPSAEARRRLDDLLEQARREDVRVRLRAVVALGQIGPQARAAAPALAAAVADPQERVGEEAAVALAKIGVLPPLVEALQAKEARVRTHAAYAFLSAPKTKEVVPPLVRALKDSEAKVRYWAAFALEEVGEAIGQEAEAAVPALRAVLADEEGGAVTVGSRARLALNALGHPLDEDDGLKTSLRIDGWTKDKRLRATLTYRWTHPNGKWVFLRPWHHVSVSYWDGKGRRVDAGDGRRDADDEGRFVVFSKAFMQREQDQIDFRLGLVVPENAATVSVPYGLLETPRVPIPARGAMP